MEKMQIFVGPPASGKSRKAREITEGKNALWLLARNGKRFPESNFQLDQVTDETEYIVIDDARGNINQIAQFFFNERLQIDRMGKLPIVVNRPKIIITTDQVDYKFDTSLSFIRRFEIVKLPNQN
jgi:hypothetical protein